MSNLELLMEEDEFQKFCTEYGFDIWQSDKTLAGVWSDITIEQILNRNFGTDLRNVQGVTPSLVTRYLLAVPAAVTIIEWVEKHCGFKLQSSDVGLLASRKQRNCADLETMLISFSFHNTFQGNS